MAHNKLERLALFGTNEIADGLEILSLKGAVYGLQPLWDRPKLVGRARTARILPDTDPAEATHPGNSVSMISAEGDGILVISGVQNKLSGWDEMIENSWTNGQIRGAILNGVLQSIDSKPELSCPVFGRGVVQTVDADNTTQAEFGVPLLIRGVRVQQDDYVAADSAGTVFISAEDIDKVLEVCEHIRDGRNPASQAVNINSSLDMKSREASAEEKELVALFTDVDTAAVSDALDKLGIPGQAQGVMPLTNYEKVTVGPAFTVRYIPADQPAGSVGDFIDDVGEGDVVVIDNGARTDCTVWGDIMTQYAGLRDIAGTVIDGVCRDVNRAISDNYPLFTVGRWMRTGKDRVEVGAVNQPVGIGGVLVKARDIVVADAGGVVFVPRHRAREVAEIAKGIENGEAGIREMIAGGATLREARKTFGYHLLQRRTE